MRTRMAMLQVAMIALMASSVLAQQPNDKGGTRAAVTDAAEALDDKGAPVLEGRLETTSLAGTPDLPVTNVRVDVKNVSADFYSYVSGVITFYDRAGVRCGEGMFKADAVAVNESFQTDAPGVRIQCTAASWRIVATSLVVRKPLNNSTNESIGSSANLIISVDGEEHPIQLNKPMKLNLGERTRTIIVRQYP